MHQQPWGHTVEDKLHLGVHEQKGLNTTGLEEEVLGSRQGGEIVYSSGAQYGVWPDASLAGLGGGRAGRLSTRILRF
jgi:hypothetical protein